MALGNGSKIVIVQLLQSMRNGNTATMRTMSMKLGSRSHIFAWILPYCSNATVNGVEDGSVRAVKNTEHENRLHR
jgi:hypothetical protein